MLNEDDGQVLLTEEGDDVIDIFHRVVERALGIGIFFEEFFLNVDDEQSGFHGVSWKF